MIFFFLSSGLFLGWSLGANDAANVFGTAVGSKMLRFRTAAMTAAICVVLGALVSGSGAVETLGRLGSINAIAGSFVAALAAGLSVFWMTRCKLPISTSQAIVGAIIGWNLFTGSATDTKVLVRIVLTWILCPVVAAGVAVILYIGLRAVLNRSSIHLLRFDAYNRAGLLAVGAFGAYSLGANNVANVVGVFAPAVPFASLQLPGGLSLSSDQILFLLGGIAIGLGIVTYSHKVMETVGGSLMKISPLAALVVVLSQAIVLLLFASKGLEQWLLTRGLPTLPLVPVSSSQAVIGAVIGIGLLRGGRVIRFRVLGEIAAGWLATPVVACVLSFVLLFVAQNVFDQVVVAVVR